MLYKELWKKLKTWIFAFWWFQLLWMTQNSILLWLHYPLFGLCFMSNYLSAYLFFFLHPSSFLIISRCHLYCTLCTEYYLVKWLKLVCNLHTNCNKKPKESILALMLHHKSISLPEESFVMHQSEEQPSFGQNIHWAKK